MPCYHPLTGFDVGLKPNGKRNIKIRPSGTEFIYYNNKIYNEPMTIPCGKCIGCRLAKSKEWANRMSLEAKEHKVNYFITLTYSDDNLPPRNEWFDTDTGEFCVSPRFPLDKKELQRFFKNLKEDLRKKTGSDSPFKYYAVGEYGSKNERPHYHAVIFFDDVVADYLKETDDLTFLKLSKEHNVYYRSNIIERHWTFGFSMVASAEWKSMAYVARYTTKKLGGDMAEIYDLNHYPKEFALISKGIAKDFYIENFEQILDTDIVDDISIPHFSRGKPSRYFQGLLENPNNADLFRDYEPDFDVDECLAILENNKLARQDVAKSLINTKMSCSGRSEFAILEAEEKYKLAKTSILKQRNFDNLDL